jgi:hypothetical protein
MAVRTVVFHEHKFAEDIGPNGSATYAKGSEVEFTIRAAKAGYRRWHFHASPVGHIIRPYQLTMSGFSDVPITAGGQRTG